ncbi:MAG: hypothetical protein HQK72_14770 [Desulfamplus sp.]|nr:hypothetical protein [Desulfamplus sp.]
MRLNHVQEKLINELMDYAKKKYPEIELGEITDSPSSSNHLWVIVKGIDWADDDKVMDFIEYVAGKQEDIFVEYGYPISLMPIRSDKNVKTIGNFSFTWE